jgi:ribosomal protein S15
VLKNERAAALGDPVHGKTTPYLESFDTGIAPEPSSTKSPTSTLPDKDAQPQKDAHLNFFLSQPELKDSLDHSTWLTSPSTAESTPEQLAEAALSTRGIDSTAEDRTAAHSQESSTAAEALRRIASLSIASSKDLLRVNKQRCISDFGRHNTDSNLPPKPAGPEQHEDALSKTPRVGPDTGSSEVQIAILTAKIRTLAGFLETRGTMDKVNKRNLRLLVHRRQKLLRYLERKERGGPRFRNVVETLGLTEGMWKGEISM